MSQGDLRLSQFYSYTWVGALKGEQCSGEAFGRTSRERPDEEGNSHRN